MIKNGIRNNLFYPLMLIIFTSSRKILSLVMKNISNFDNSLILTLIMFFSEFIFGLILYIRQFNFGEKKKEKTLMGIELIYEPIEITHPDSDFKIILLIFFATFFDFIEFILKTYYLPKKIQISNINISSSLDIRLNNLIAIFLALFCFCLLKFPILRHQIFSLIIISICLIIIILFEYYVINKNEENLLLFTFILCLILLDCFFISLKDIITKYLLEYNYINIFKLVMLEGLVGFIISTIYSLILHFIIKQNIFEEILEFNKKIYFLIVFLILYFILSGFKNSYRTATIYLFSPMTRIFTDSFIDPALIIYNYFKEDDFQINHNRNLYYFITNLIISVIIVFCGLIYNEILVLFCCSLERDTYCEVSKRAKHLEQSIDSLLGESGHNIPVDDKD